MTDVAHTLKLVFDHCVFYSAIVDSGMNMRL